MASLAMRINARQVHQSGRRRSVLPELQQGGRSGLAPLPPVSFEPLSTEPRDRFDHFIVADDTLFIKVEDE